MEKVVDIDSSATVFRCGQSFNPSLNNKILDRTNLIAFADGKLNFAKMAISLFDRVENTVGKENAGYQDFLLFTQ